MDDCEICDGDYDDNVDVVLDAGVDAGRAAGDLIRRIAARRGRGYQRLSTLRHLRTIVGRQCLKGYSTLRYGTGDRENLSEEGGHLVHITAYSLVYMCGEFEDLAVAKYRTVSAVSRHIPV